MESTVVNANVVEISLTLRKIDGIFGCDKLEKRVKKILYESYLSQIMPHFIEFDFRDAKCECFENDDFKSCSYNSGYIEKILTEKGVLEAYKRIIT